MFNDYNDTINFLTSKGTYENHVINEQTHDPEMNKSLKGDNFRTENFIPKSMVKLKDIYDLQYRFKKLVNAKTNSPTMNHEIINLGTNQNLRNVNIGLGCSPSKRIALINILK